jgi:hypothetical protein
MVSQARKLLDYVDEHKVLEGFDFTDDYMVTRFSDSEQHINNPPVLFKGSYEQCVDYIAANPDPDFVISTIMGNMKAASAITGLGQSGDEVNQYQTKEHVGVTSGSY